MEFEWDNQKAELNLKKHEISFEEASTVFGDNLARIFDDDEYSFDEKRNGIVGYSSNNRLLIISFTERDGDIIRIISARETTPKERRNHEYGNG
jgi:uncharacterized protein